MFHKSLVLVFVMFSPLGLSEHGRGSSGGRAPAPPTISDFSNVGYLGTSSHYCSGVAICDKLVLTAAHCAKYATYQGAFFSTKSSNVNSVHNKEYSHIDRVLWTGDDTRGSKDLALIKTKDPVTAPAFRQPMLCDWKTFRNWDAIDDNLQLVGYASRNGTPPQRNVLNVTATGNRGLALTWKVGRTGQIGTYGDSGGGVFWRGRLVSIESHVGERSPKRSIGPQPIFHCKWLEKMMSRYCSASNK